ncbi:MULTISPECIES: succinate dehydrogenase, hydrophobic membrane anchor protein [unclassified Devosia]|jgi:succinate dehydrogenase / fumarate reductase membrane anchor subunit|uniref:succinate dehydrogenase, hydrophobic membrane anchor protein n=1 Tax=unclassified Devosia TaxID=196773 RepID=UPI0015569488|nr:MULTISPECIES: succinate dehydrogenase, hydrophobic membrane anchor protein [unclassified Devosia]
MREQIISKATIANPKSKYGDARSSTSHFILQRLSGVSNIVFLGFLIFIVVRLAGQDRAEMVEVIGNAWIGLPFAVLLVIVTLHMHNGMRDILEDYFAGRTYSLYMMLNTMWTLAIAVIGVFSILKLVFWG